MFRRRFPIAATAAFSTRRPTVTHDSLDKAQVPSVRDDSPHAKAVRAVESMSVEERVGQLVMAPLFVGSDPSSLYDLIANRHVGSVLIIGNWTSGIAGVAAATSTLQSYAPAPIRSRPRPRNSKDMRRPAIVSSSPPIRRVVWSSISRGPGSIPCLRPSSRAQWMSAS